MTREESLQRDRRIPVMVESGLSDCEIASAIGLAVTTVRIRRLRYSDKGPHETLQNKRERYCRAAIGCRRDVYRALTGNAYKTRDIHAAHFRTQRNNAKKRSIPFALTFPEWWNVWQDSGHYGRRGRGDGYVMGRIGDTGGYTVGNVMICTQSQNAHDQYFSGKTRKNAITVRAPRREYKDAYVPANALANAA